MLIQDEKMLNNIIDVYDMEIVRNERPFTAIALTRLVHMISSTRVEYSKYNTYEKVKKFE